MMSRNVAEGFAYETSDVAEGKANFHEEIQERIPHFSENPLSRSRVFQDEILDSQEDSGYSDLENDDYFSRDCGCCLGDIYSKQFESGLQRGSWQVSQEKIVVNQQHTKDNKADCQSYNHRPHLSEVPEATPGDDIQSRSYNCFLEDPHYPPESDYKNRSLCYEVPNSQESFADEHREDRAGQPVSPWHQENPNLLFDRDLDEHSVNEATSFCSEATDIIPGGTKLTSRKVIKAQISKRQYPLHKRGINCNGRLASESPQHRRKNMDEVATQPTTQPQYDARRLGTSSNLSKQDEGDIIAILHPTSPGAHVAVKLTAEASPQHIWQNHNKSHIVESGESQLEDPYQTTENAQENARDIALRFSSRVNDIRLGFVFGRNVHKSDIILVREEHKENRAQKKAKNHAISNKHFRIYINRNGILMLEDMSTNGTIVDNIVLHGPKVSGQSDNSRMTLHSGVMVELPTTGTGESIRFIVAIPPRYFPESGYNENLFGYLACVDQAERKAAAVAEATAGKKDVPNVPVLTNALPSGLLQPATPNASTILPATGGNNYGLHWNGGEKYNVVGHIGAGAFATVFKLASKRDGEVYAVKQLEKRKFLKDGIVSKKFHNELNVMMKARHPNIIEYREHHETSTHLFIVMDYIPFGDLRHWTDYGKAMTEYMAARVGRQMIDAISYLHENGITHRDIKPDNILVAGDDPLDKIFKLADFGLSKQIIDDQTFLQTFCGTLLYLAPEVYPGFERAKAGLSPSAKRTRGQAAPLPYQHSVDIWSLGTVLYQLLAGKPPFTGSNGDNGDVFLNTVMSVPVDYERLIYGGVTEDAIDFVSRMLVIEPHFRARETDLINHPWLIPRPYPAVGGEGAFDEAEALDASQLSLAENIGNRDELRDLRNTKRFRGEEWIAEEDYDLPEAESHELLPGGLPPSYFEPSNSEVMLRMSGPPPPQSQSVLYPGIRPLSNTRVPPQPERLFGEIGSSALRSSGVLGQNVNRALEVSMEEGSGDESEGGSFPEQGPSEFASGGDTHVNTPREDIIEGTVQHDAQHPQMLSDTQHDSAAPSLLGTEALVDQLNMSSQESGMSAPSMDSKPATPKVSLIHEYSPTSSATKRPSQAVEHAADDSERKRSKTNNKPSSSHTQHRPVTSPPQQRSVSSNTGSRAPEGDVTAKVNKSIAGAKSQPPSQSSNSDNHQDGRRTRDHDKPVSQPKTEPSSQESASQSSVSSNGSKTAVEPRGKAADTASMYPSMDLVPPSGSTDDGFLKPSMRFGNLFLTKGSIKSVRQIKITSMGTSFGRNPNCKYIHPNVRDRRIPKNAFDIQMWYPGMEKDLESGKVDWANNPALTAVISTRTSIAIAVNGVRLAKGANCWLFGRLRTGDVISVIELPEGQVPRTDYDKEYLRYRCEFFIGASKSVRGEGEPFAIEQEDQKYMKHYGIFSRESSIASAGSAEGQIASTKTTIGANTTASAAAGAKQPVPKSMQASTTTQASNSAPFAAGAKGPTPKSKETSTTAGASNNASAAAVAGAKNPTPTTMVTSTTTTVPTTNPLGKN